MKIQLENSSSSIANEIETELLNSLRENSEQSINEQFVLSLKSGNDQLIGGLTASTSYGWLLIKILWVHKAYRGKGYGKQLMQRAHEKGRQVNCHSAWLDTSSPLAQQFYSSLGYSIFGKLNNQPHQTIPSHRRYFMRIEL